MPYSTDIACFKNEFITDDNPEFMNCEFAARSHLGDIICYINEDVSDDHPEYIGCDLTGVATWNELRIGVWILLGQIAFVVIVYQLFKLYDYLSKRYKNKNTAIENSSTTDYSEC